MDADFGKRFLRFVKPVVDALQKLGGSGKASEVTDYVVDFLDISEDELEETLKSGQSRVYNQIHWAKFYLSKCGYIESSERGVWALTEKGLKANLEKDDVLSIFNEVQTRFKRSKNHKTTTDDIEDKEVLQSDHKVALLELIKNLTADGFERLCQRLLRESGFTQVTVTGKSGDGGIDGHGILEINPLVSFKVFFQCKKYKDVVSPTHIRDFRGSMMGRGDKGIFISTGRFTKDAKEEAKREGVPPIELVDGDKLIHMFEEIELGLIPKTVFEIDEEFFDEFK